MEQRFFVTIFAANQSALKDITRLSLDLFGSSTPRRGESSTGGLLTKAQIKKIEKSGYRVEVHDEYVEQSRRSEVMAQSDGSSKLQRATESIRQDLQFFAGKTAIDGFRSADAQPRRK